jgi:hypothetical protein
MSASEFDQLISREGVLMAGRFGSGWTVTDHKCKGLFLESPAALEMARSFCAAITMMFNSLAFAADSITRTGQLTAPEGLGLHRRRLLHRRARRPIRHRRKQENPELRRAEPTATAGRTLGTGVRSPRIHEDYPKRAGATGHEVS